MARNGVKRAARAGRALAAAAVAAVGVSHAAGAQTSCGSYDFAGPFAASFLAGEPFADAARAGEVMTGMADAACHQGQLVAKLGETLGGVAGYKAAATSPGAQKQLGLDGPVLGILFAQMIQDDGASVAIDSGARMIVELDLMARVASEAINDATTREEALAALDAFVPFIELGDLMVPKGAAITGPLLQAMNAGARAGIIGEPVGVDSLSPGALGAIAATLSKDGTVIAEGEGSALLGHPLDAVLWIVDATKARGDTLKDGDLLSLGSLDRFHIAAPGEYVATYEGLGAAPARASVTLR